MPIGELCAVAAALTWAVGSLLFGGIGRTVAPGAMSLGKTVTAAILLSLTAVLMGGTWPEAASGGAGVLIAVSGVVGLTIGDTAYFGAIVTLGVPRAMLLLSTAPVFACFGAWAFLDEPLGFRAALGIVLTMAGVGLVVMRPAEGAPRVTGRGVALGFVAALGQAGGSLLSRKAMQTGIDPLAAAAGRLVTASLGLVVLAMVTGRAVAWTSALAKDRAWAKVAGASVLGSYLGIWLAQTAIARSASTGVASTLLATAPVFALPLSHATGGERVTPRSALGAAVAISGIALLSLRPGGG